MVTSYSSRHYHSADAYPPYQSVARSKCANHHEAYPEPVNTTRASFSLDSLNPQQNPEINHLFKY
jgi:hypothetical protein